MPENDLKERYQKLQEILKGYGKLAVAFSAGVDSTFLLMAAKEALGDQVLAVSARLHSSPKLERDQAAEFCSTKNIPLLIVDFDELSVPGFSGNPPDRCYICKKALFTRLKAMAKEQGFRRLAEGSNTDDDGDYRPGIKAIGELGILSPLKEAGLSKQDIRELSRELGLPTWNKPSMACLSSRVPYGEMITEEKLEMIDRGEEMLRSMGFSNVRVRIHGDSLARIEVDPKDITRLTEVRETLNKTFAAIGFRYITADLRGYRVGSTNEALGSVYLD